MLELQLRLAGVGLIILALLHAGFPRRFGWRAELGALTVLNRQLFYVHTLFIAITVAFFGVLSFVAADGLDQPLAVVLMGGFTAFWAVRLVVQLFVFDPALWRGRRFETVMHVGFTGLWTYLTALYAVAFWRAAA